MNQAVNQSPPLSAVQWTIITIAAIGFAFDSYELLMLPLIVRPALAELLGVAGNSLGHRLGRDSHTTRRLRRHLACSAPYRLLGGAGAHLHHPALPLRRRAGFSPTPEHSCSCAAALRRSAFEFVAAVACGRSCSTTQNRLEK